jgi:polyhydroxyalkanoate synthase subunit PhaC
LRTATAIRSAPADGEVPRRARSGPRPLAQYLQVAAVAGGSQRLSDGSWVDVEQFLAGVRAYWRHPYRRPVSEPATVWRQGAARLLDHAGEGPPILVVPSLINRAYILDLSPELSLLRHLAKSGFRPLLLDWGAPEGADLRLTLADQIHSRAQAALDATLGLAGERPVLLGYCMGGLLAAGLAQARRRDLAGLALLATPWDFHAVAATSAPLIDSLLPLTASVAGLGFAPVELLQAFFAQLGPLGVVEKFQRFAEMPAVSARARLFVAVEDWLNDGVPLAGPVAQECLWQWYAENRPARGLWAPGGVAVRPEELDLPAFVAIPRRDRIVPAASAEPLAAGLPEATVIRPAAGHVSMVVGDSALEQLWQPFTDWLRRIAPRRSPCPVRPASVNP